MKPVKQALLVAVVLFAIFMIANAVCGQHPASCQVMKPSGGGWGIGSAGLVGHRLVVTNHHVAGSKGRVKVCWPTGREVLGTVIGADRVYDIAVVKLDKPITDIRIFGVREAYPKAGGVCFQDGAPRGRRWRVRKVRIVRTGETPNWSFGKSALPYVKWSLPSIDGESGGPVYGANGNIYALCMATSGSDSRGPSGYHVCRLFRRLFPGCMKGRQFRPP